jgi:hypothetical protein
MYAQKLHLEQKQKQRSSLLKEEIQYKIEEIQYKME